MKVHNFQPFLNKEQKSTMKERITITVDKDLLKWIDNQVDDKVFANRSHAIEFLIKRKMEEK